MVTPAQGEIWWAETESARRPVLVVTRDAAIDRLKTLIVAPITRTRRGIPTEIRLGTSEGLREDCVATFDNLFQVPPTLLTDRVGDLGARQFELCLALSALADC